jgi:hypothetical protein
MLVLVQKRKLLFGQFTLISPLTVAECASRLMATTRDERSSLFGAAKENYFRVAWRYQPTVVRVRNSFRPYLFGKLESFDGGTLVRCHFTLHPLVMAVLLWIAGMGGVGVIMLHNWILVLFPRVIVLAGVALSWGERELLVHDVATAINAHLER